MKVYSDNAVTSVDLSAVNKKQTAQIIALRWAVGLTFFVNLGITLALKFL